MQHKLIFSYPTKRLINVRCSHCTITSQAIDQGHPNHSYKNHYEVIIIEKEKVIYNHTVYQIPVKQHMMKLLGKRSCVSAHEAIAIMAKKNGKS